MDVTASSSSPTSSSSSTARWKYDVFPNEKAIEKQWSPTYEEISCELNKLEFTKSTIQDVLQDAEEKQAALTAWLDQVKDVFYDFADVQDEFECEALRRQVVEKYGSTDSASYSSFNLRDFSHKIKVIRERFEEIEKVRAQFHLVERIDDKLIVQRKMTHSFVRESDVIGRDEDKEKIIDLLMHPSEDEKYPNEKKAPETLPLDEKKAPETLPLYDKTASVTLPLDDKNTLMKQTTVEQAVAQLRPSPREILSLDDKLVKQTTEEQAAPLLLRLIKILSSVEERLKTPNKAKEFPTPKIQKVKDLMSFEKYYKPRLLSLGPIHHDKEKYQLGEKYKLVWASNFNEGCRKTMDNLYKKIEEKIEELRDCYEEKVTENYDDKDLAWLLFVDGCAILQFIYCAINKGNSKLGIINNSVDFVHRDLFLLENQLPYRLLKMLTSDNEKDLRDSIKTYIRMHVMVPEGNPEEQLRDEEPIHLLDLLRIALLGNPHEDSVIIRNRERDQHWISHRNVQELKAAGIHLRRSSNSCLRDISFSQSLNLLRHLYIPPITLNNLTRPMFMNLVAYENCDNFKNDIGVTSYIAFLRSLIKEAKDVRELRKAGIFYNLVVSDEEVAKLFNEMPMPFIPTNIGVEEKIEEYYGTMLSLMFRIYHDNFNSTSRGIFKLLVVVLGLSGIKYMTRMYPFIHAYFITYVLLALSLYVCLSYPKGS